MLVDGTFRTKTLPAVKVTKEERESIENRIKELGFDKFSQYIRYCINKEMGEE
jgi:hypothetical protein